MSRATFVGGFVVLLFCLALPVFAVDGLYGDFTGNGIVEMNDLPDFLDYWLEDDCNETNGVDLDENCIVNFYEFSAFANNWLLKYTPTATSPQNLMVPPMGWDDTQIILIWSKPVDYSQVTDYRVYQNGTALGLSGRFDTNRAKLYYIVTGLTPNTTYNFTVKSLNAGTELAASNTVTQSTVPAMQVFNVTNYGAVGDGTTLNTTAIQNAINACTPGGKVLIPSGTFLSGAIFLKSNMTLQIDGTLLGSSAAADYPWTCWRFPYYASGKNYMGLINAYYDYNNPNSYGKPYGSITNVRICGSGVVNGCKGYSASNPHTITGHKLTTLGTAEASAHGDSARADLITVKGINQVYVGGWGGTLTLVYPAEHTIFVSYCNGVTVNAVNCDTYDIHNGDGINLCTSDTAYIFNSTFDTGDDCINTNAGVGADGVAENYPDNNIRIFNCTTNRGHGGVVFGSFTAAWIQNVLIEDCTFDGTEIGLRFKTGSKQGGGARYVTARDITMSNIQKDAPIFMDSTYSCEYPSAGPGQFRDITVQNITVSNSSKRVIYIYGLSGYPHTNLTLTNINSNISSGGGYLNYCTNSTFDSITMTNYGSPAWSQSNTSGLTFINCNPAP
jgi:exo-poly-alpha-galacturonosidase